MKQLGYFFLIGLLCCCPLEGKERRGKNGSKGSKKVSRPSQKIIILTTYNLNSNFERMARFYTYIQKMRSQYPGRVLLLDTGKQWDRKNFDTRLSRRSLNIQLMNFMGYQGAIASCADLTLKSQVWSKLFRQSKFPWIGSNVVSSKGQYLFAPYWIFQMGGKKIAIFSIANPKVLQNPYYKASLNKISLHPGDQALSRLLPSLSKQVDLSVLLSNSGALSDVYLATKFDSLHLICGVAKHAKKPYIQKVNRASMVWQAPGGRWMSQLTLTWQGLEMRPSSIAFQAIDSEKLAPHPGFISLLGRARGKLKKGPWQKEFAYWNGSLLRYPKAQQALTLLFCKILKKETNAEVVLVHLPIFQKKIFQKKKITRRDLWEVFPIPGNAVEALLSGKVLRSIWENSPQNHIFPYGMDGQKQNGKMVFYVGDEILQEKKLYHVVICMANMGGILTAKVLKIIEKDFFSNFVEDIEKTEFSKKNILKGGVKK